MLGLSGCSQSNEDFVKAQATANAGTATPAATGPQPTSQRQYFEQQQQRKPNAMPAGYPGAK